MARLKDQYKKTAVPVLMKEFGYANIMAVPKLEKITINPIILSKNIFRL